MMSCKYCNRYTLVEDGVCWDCAIANITKLKNQLTTKVKSGFYRHVGVLWNERKRDIIYHKYAEIHLGEG